MLTLEQIRALRFFRSAYEQNRPYTFAEAGNAICKNHPLRLVKICESLQAEGFIQFFRADGVSSLHDVQLSYIGLRYPSFLLRRAAFAVLRWFWQNLVPIAALIVSAAALLRAS